ncbi:MAG: PHP domain-containing protein [Betaproteobacteria bacterium]|nr:PHP domain-containing protein [Betaproteobacteria bacterium]
MRVVSVIFFLLTGCAYADAPSLVLRGSLTGADHQSYRSVPFVVPSGTERITIAFAYSGKEEHSVIDLGVLGPSGELRGWSGGNKSVVTLSSVDATPSYSPTAIIAGKWALLLGVPNMRAHATASYTANIYFSKSLAVADEPAILRSPLRSGTGWFRGDLHSHTAHSDGSCASRSGKLQVPCPVFLTAQAAVARGLDFTAITDHNAVSQANAIRELQPYFDRLLLIPGRELTTFFGHANFFGSLAPIDFRIGRGGLPDWNAQLAAIAPLHGLISINHPVRPSGELCMGCGWDTDTDTDMRRVQAIEAVNGADADTPYSGIPFWQNQLNHGLRISAVGGSDNHHADQTDTGAGGSVIGRPTTVVYAAELSQLAILDAIRAGHVFIDVTGSPDRLLEMTAQADGAQAMMGDALPAPADATVNFKLHVTHARGGNIQVLQDGKATNMVKNTQIGNDDLHLDFDWISDGKPHWIRVDVRDAGGSLILLGNPIYINHSAA